MKRIFIALALSVLLIGCMTRSRLMRIHSPGAESIGGVYTLIIFKSEKVYDAIQAALLDLEGDGLTYEPHPDEVAPRLINGLSYADAYEEAFQSLRKQCGFFTLTSRRLTNPGNVTTGYEILPVIKETIYCQIDGLVSLQYSEPENGTIIVRLPAQTVKPFGYTPAQ